MQTNPLLAKSEKTALTRLLSSPMLVLAILASSFYLELKWLGSSLLIFHQTKNGWEQLPTPGSYPEALQVSSGGMVWAATLGRAPLSRWDGASWRHYNSSDFGTRQITLSPASLWMESKSGPQPERAFCTGMASGGNVTAKLLRTLAPPL
jgi:hypothetical protein